MKILLTAAFALVASAAFAHEAPPSTKPASPPKSTAATPPVVKPVTGHSGGTDAYGCHTNHATGDYHCHKPK